MRFRGRPDAVQHARRLTPPGVTARLRYLRIALAAAYACGMLSSPGLWFGTGRTFPRAPLLNALPAFLSAADYLASVLLFAALALTAISRRPGPYLACALALTALLVVLDQTRLQPWVYQYFLMLGVLACGRWGEANEAAAGRTLAASQLIIAALYFWSGAQKLNWSFGHEVMPALLASAGVRWPGADAAYLPVAGLVVAACEAFIGIALLVRITRRAAVVLALAMHSLLLLILVAASHNSVVWAWNAGMMVMVGLLFWRMDQPHDWRTLGRWRGAESAGHSVRAVLLLCGLAPALSFAGWWDLYLSAALYSGNAPVAVARISEPVRAMLPASAGRQVFATGRGELMLPFYEWSLAELNVPPYPEVRVYRQLARELCRSAGGPEEIELIVKESPSRLDGGYAVSRADCSALFSR
ncbi:MAG TPA: hypothetical protein VF723_11125 [Pyrinomonadaceae bacterium]|jgi:hypothetical protein